VKRPDPLAVGTPEITPVDAAILRPAGNAPDAIDHVYCAFPPVALREPPYNSPAVAPGNVEELILNACGAACALIDIVSATCAACAGEPASFTVTPKEYVPLFVGVP
jgi:hypothetical protein